MANTIANITRNIKLLVDNVAAHADYVEHRRDLAVAMSKLRSAQNNLAELWETLQDDKQTAHELIVRKINPTDRIRTPLGSEWQPDSDYNSGCIHWNRRDEKESDQIVVWATPGCEVPDDVIAVQVGTWDGDVYSLDGEPVLDVKMTAVTREAYLAEMPELLAKIEVALAQGRFGEDARRPVHQEQVQLKEPPVHAVKGCNDPEPDDELPDPDPDDKEFFTGMLGVPFEKLVNKLGVPLKNKSVMKRHLEQMIEARVKAARIQHSRRTDELASTVAGRVQAAISDCAVGILEGKGQVKRLDAYEMIRDLTIDIGATFEECGIVKSGEAWADEGLDVDPKSCD